MMPIIKMPDGNQVNFPDDMPKEQIKGLILSKFPELGEKKSGEQGREEMTKLTPLSEDQKAKTPIWRQLKEFAEIPENFWEGEKEGVENSLRRIANGATLGLSDKVNTYFGGDAVKLKERLQQEADVSGVGGLHKWTDDAAEFGGSMIPTAKLYGLANKYVGPATSMILSGGVEKALKDAINSDSLDEARANGITGAIFGAGEGALFGGALKLAKGVYWLAKKPTQKAVQYLKETVGEEALNGFIQKAKEQGRSLVEVIDDKVADMLGMAQRQSQKANEIVSSRMDDIMAGAAAKKDDFIANYHGNVQGWKNRAEIKKAIDTEAQPVWDNVVYPQGDVASKSPEIANLVKNNGTIQRIIRDIKNNPDTKREIRNLPDGHIKLLERVRQKLEKEISGGIRTGTLTKGELDDLMDTQNLFVGALKKNVKGYGEVLGMNRMAHELENSAKMASQIFKPQKTEEFIENISQLSEPEKEAVRLEFKTKLDDLVGGKAEGYTWQDFSKANVQKKIKAVMGEEEGQKIIDFAKAEKQRASNFKKTNAGVVVDPEKKGYVYRVGLNQLLDAVDRTILRGRRGRNIGIAELLSSPTTQALESALYKSKNNKVVNTDNFLKSLLGKNYKEVGSLMAIDEINRRNNF